MRNRAGWLFLALVLAGCKRAPQPPAGGVAAGDSVRDFAEEVSFLRSHGEVLVLRAPNGARVAVSPTYQGRVMTSAVAPDAPGLGWINRAFIEAGRTGTQFDNYGGEDRFWLGPEGGQYGLYFPTGASFEFARWQVPAALNEGSWETRARSDTSVTFVRPMMVTNYGGARFDLTLERTVRLLGAEEAARQLGAPLPAGVSWVGYESVNRVTNTGPRAWSADTVLLSVWILGMYEPFGSTSVVIPFDTAASGPVVNDAYFGKVPADRLRVRDGYLLFSADGKYRSKIGLPPARAAGRAGSWNEAARLLTLVRFDQPAGAKEYVNSMWERQEHPYGGDVFNSYNDGSPGPGLPPLGGFYEMESSSPALALRPGESAVHSHRTLHLTGPRDALDAVARAGLGVPLSAIMEGSR
jgi:hypothetical protein